MCRPKHVRPEDYPLHIRAERYVWFKLIIVFRQVHQLLCLEKPGFDELIWVWPNAIRFVSDQLRLKQIDPLTIARCRHTIRTAAITCEECPVGRHIEVH